MTTPPLILLAAGGTGGHLFPAEALGVELIRRGYRVRLVTDARALRYSGLFSKDTIDMVPSETVRGRTPWSLARTGAMLAAGTMVALNLMRRLKPAAVIGFGGYPTVPPLLAARLFGVPTLLHEANAVLGRANRFLSSRVSAIATSLPGVLDRDPALAPKTTTVGTPMRPAILAAAAVKFVSPEPMGALRLLVVGGSQGARVMADIVPGAIEHARQRGCDRADAARQKTVGAAEHRIGLVQQRRHAEQPCCQQRRHRRIAAEANHGGGLQSAHQIERHDRAGAQHHAGIGQRQGVAAAHGFARHHVDRVLGE